MVHTEPIANGSPPGLGLTSGEVTAEVRERRVTLRSHVEENSLVPVIERLCQDVDGVVSVQAHLDHRVDAAD